MRVHFWAGGIHPISETFLLDPPPGVEMSSNVHRSQYGEYGRSRGATTGMAGSRQVVDCLSYGAGMPRFTPILTNADLIHTLSGVVPMSTKPWISSVEMPSSFYGLRDEWAFSARRRALLRFIISSDNCRRILCFSRATERSLVHSLNCGSTSAIENKIETLYPSVNAGRFERGKCRETDEFRILFIGNHFFDKGGRELFRAVSDIARENKVKLTVVASAPPHHMHMFTNFVNAHDERWVEWHTGGIARNRLIEEFYPSAHLFVMPSYIDLFGYVFLEAMASGLPIIGARVNAQEELVDHSQNGYLVNAPVTPFEGEHGIRTARAVSHYREKVLDESVFDGVVRELKERILTLIDDERLRKRMADKSIEMVTIGRFGIDTRNRRLSEIYRESVG